MALHGKSMAFTRITSRLASSNDSEVGLPVGYISWKSLSPIAPLFRKLGWWATILEMVFGVIFRDSK